MSAQVQHAIRGEAARAALLLVEILLGAWLLCLFLLALAWDPLDRRMGFRARRHVARLGATGRLPVTTAVATTHEAYAAERGPVGMRELASA